MEARKKIQIEFDRKLVEIEARTRALIQLLQEGEDAKKQWYEGEEEELGTTEHEEEFHIIQKPEQGVYLGEEGESDGDANKRLAESLTEHLENGDQYGEVIPQASNEATRPYVFKTNNLCMIVGFNGDVQPSNVVSY